MTNSVKPQADPMAGVDAAATRLFGQQHPCPTAFGDLMLTGLRRSAVIVTVEIFGTDDQRALTHAAMERNRQATRARAGSP